MRVKEVERSKAGSKEIEQRETDKTDKAKRT